MTRSRARATSVCVKSIYTLHTARPRQIRSSTAKRYTIIIDRPPTMGSSAKCIPFTHKNVTMRRNTLPEALQQPTSASNVSGRILLVMYINMSSSFDTVSNLVCVHIYWRPFRFDSTLKQTPAGKEAIARLPLFGTATPPENKTVNEPSNPLCQLKYVHVAQVAYVRGLQGRVIHARQGSNFEVFRDTMLGPWDQQNRWHYTPYEME